MNNCDKDQILQNIKDAWVLNSQAVLYETNRTVQKPEPGDCGKISGTRIVTKESVCTFMVQ